MHSMLTPLLLLLLSPLIYSQSSHDESLRVILCSSLICDHPKVCDIFEGIPQCRPPPTTTSTTTTTTLPTVPGLLWTTPTPFPTFPPFTFSTPPPVPSSSPSSPPSICSLPPDTGPCSRARIMWYFDTETSSCQRFSFSGCGNGNRFSSRYQCELNCLTEGKEEKELNV